MDIWKAEIAKVGSSKDRFKSICVFGESNFGKDRKFLKEANEVGKLLAAQNINLVYGGGIHGLRGVVATSASIGGSTELQVSSLLARQGYMLYSAQAFIALPGGGETMEALSSIVYWASINMHKKPLGLLNVNGFYDGLLSFLDKAVEQEFISRETRRTIISAPTAAQLLAQLHLYAPVPEPVLIPISRPPPNRQSCPPPDRGKRSPDTSLRL